MSFYGADEYLCWAASKCIKRCGRWPTELVVYPGEFHGFTRPSFIRDRYERWLAWWDKYLKPGPS
jgi:dipeptidyl aminopeptidase/acylaminoacyl peptidase